MSITHEAYLNIVPGDSPAPIIKVSQYDADFSIVFHLIAKKRGIVPAYPRTVENDEDITINVPTSATVSVRGTKTDGNGYSANATLSGTATAPIVTVAGHEQMTASAGVNIYEITFYADNATKRLSTANFILFVEPAALDASTITSESLMLELNDLIASVPNAVAAADRAEQAVQSVEGVTTQVATNTQDISDIKADISRIEPGLSAEAKVALLACFAKVAWIDEHGQDYYDALEAALYSYEVVSISAVYTQSGSVDISDSLDSLKSDLVVEATLKDSTTQVISDTDYVLSGSLEEGTSVITVTYQNKTTTFDVIVTDRRLVYEITPETVCNKNVAISTGVSVPAHNVDFTIIASAKVDKSNNGELRRYIAGWGGLNNETRAVLRMGIDYYRDSESNIDGKCHFISNYIFPDTYINESQDASTEHEVIWIIRNSGMSLTKALYINGSRVYKTVSSLSSYSQGRGGTITVGATGTNDTDKANSFKGTIHMFNIYNTALSDDEIESLLGVSLS